jgi:hypothetical protein
VYYQVDIACTVRKRLCWQLGAGSLVLVKQNEVVEKAV